MLPKYLSEAGVVVLLCIGQLFDTSSSSGLQASSSAADLSDRCLLASSRSPERPSHLRRH